MGVDIAAFRTALDAFLSSDIHGWDSDGVVERLIQDVPGLSSPAKLGLLRLTAAHLPANEAYLEVGSWKGLSIIAAMLGNEHAPFYAIESFKGYGVDATEVSEALRANVERWVGRDRLRLLKGDCFDLLVRDVLIPEPIGAYFYDANHSLLGQYLALGLVERHLAENAIVIIDDTASSVVARATDRYVASRPEYELLVELPGSAEGGTWWNGMRIYAFRRSVAAPASFGSDVQWRRALYRLAYRPAAHAVGRLMPHAGLKLAHAVKSLPQLLRGRRTGPIGSFSLLERQERGKQSDRGGSVPSELGSATRNVGVAEEDEPVAR